MKRRAALVTGASRGLGAQLARGFWADGYDLVLAARGAAELGRLAAELEAAGQPEQKAVTVSGDVASGDTTAALARLVDETFGGLDCLVCNAAVQGPIGPFHETDFDAWRATVEVDLVAQARLAHAIIPRMTGGGTILFLSGGGATAPRPFFSAYAAAKAGLVRFAETLAHELRPLGITVNAIAPGAMPTAMMDEIRAAGAKAGARELELAGKVLDAPNDVAAGAVRLALFLASDAARAITGRLVSAQWDRYEDWPAHREALEASDLYTLRRITGRDRGLAWGDR